MSSPAPQQVSSFRLFVDYAIALQEFATKAAPPTLRRFLLAFLALCCAALVSCGGGGPGVGGGDGGAVLTSIAVTPTNPTIATGRTEQFTATGTYSDTTTQNLTTSVTWSSSNTSVATVSSASGTNGLASAVAAGTAMVTATSGNISGTTTLTVATSIPQGAFNFTGTYPAPTVINFTDPAGNAHSWTGFAGQITLVAPSGTSVSVMTNWITSKGGAIIAQVPALGFYWASVTPGTEAAFISAVQTNAPVALYAFPAAPGAPAQTGVYLDLRDPSQINNPTPLSGPGDIAQIDHYNAATDPAGGTCPAGISHGDFVTSVATNTGAPNPGVSITKDDKYQADVAGGVAYAPAIVTSPEDLGFGLARVAQGAANANEVKVVNLSLQGIFGGVLEKNPVTGKPEGDEGTVDRHSCVTSDPICAQLTNDEAALLEHIYLAIQNMDASVRDHLVVVIAAGNSGLDLTGIMNFLNSVAPDAASHILLVGGTQSDGQTPEVGFNSSQNPSDMIFVQGDDVEATVNGTPCMSSGTSFAAPQVSQLAAQLIKSVPGLTGAQVVQAIKNAAPTGAMTVSFLPNGYKTKPTLTQAVAAAKVLLNTGNPGPLTGTWAGTWTRPISGLCSFETSSLTWSLTQTGSNVSGTFQGVVTAIDTSGICPDPVGATSSGNLVQGSVSGNSLTIFTDGGTQFTGTFTATTISGTGGTSLGTGPFTLNKQ
jgi:hypothetical protein